MKVKEETEKVGLKLNIQKTKIMASGPITSWGQTANAGDIRDVGFISGLGTPLEQGMATHCLQCHESHSIVHQALYLTDLGP